MTTSLLCGTLKLDYAISNWKLASVKFCHKMIYHLFSPSLAPPTQYLEMHWLSVRNTGIQPRAYSHHILKTAIQKLHMNIAHQNCTSSWANEIMSDISIPGSLGESTKKRYSIHFNASRFPNSVQHLVNKKRKLIIWRYQIQKLFRTKWLRRA